MEGFIVMNRLKGVVLVAVATLIAVSGSLITINNSSAAESSALSIDPKKNYTIEPGKSVTDTLKIRNLDKNEPLNLSLRVVDFSYVDQTGAPKLMLDEDAPQTTWSLKPFLTVPKSVSIEPGAMQTIDLGVSIPEGHGAGDFYSAIVYSSGGADGGNIGLSASGVTLAFVNVPGQVDENLEFKKIGAYNPAEAKSDGGGFKLVTGEKPLRIGYTLENKGNVTESPSGSITLKPLFGKEVVVQNINPSGSLALIGQTRLFTPCIKLNKQEADFQGTRAEMASCAEPDLIPGLYKIELNAYYGQNGNRTQELTGNGWFWYLPWWFVLTALAIIAFVGYHAWKIVSYIRSRRGTPKLKKKSNK